MRTRSVVAAAVSVGAFAASAPTVHATVARLTATPDRCTTCHSGSAVVTRARHYLGVPYVWGGEDPATGLDCSGFVQRVYRDLGTELPRTAAEQQHAGQPVRSLVQARPGDLLFWDHGAGDHHVAIYEGGGRLIEAPQPGMIVSERNVYSGAIAIRRIPINGGQR